MLFIATEIQNIQIADGDISRGILDLFIALEIQNIQIADGDISRGNSCFIYNIVLFLATEITIADGDISRRILVLFITLFHV